MTDQCPYTGNAEQLAEEIRRYAPEPVDFGRIALRAVEAGLFVDDPEIEAQNLVRDHEVRIPTRMLETTYGNGPGRIRLGEADVPIDAMVTLRKSIVSANRLLLPQDSVMSYFHERYTSDDTYRSAGTYEALGSYDPGIGKLAAYQNSDLSFNTTADRRVRQRELYTIEEEEAALDLGVEHPEAVMAIISYQGVLKDYMRRLGNEFALIAEQSPGSITTQNLKEFNVLAKQWSGSNFTDKLLPALAIFIAKERQAKPETPFEELITKDMFQAAVNFAISNGAFIHFVKVPSYVADDGKERVNQFSCPAVGAIRNHLLDGSLLDRIYQTSVARIADGDESALQLRAAIQSRAQAAFMELVAHRQYQRLEAQEAAEPYVYIDTEDIEWVYIASEAIVQALAKSKAANLTYEGVNYIITEEDANSITAEEPKRPDDIEIAIPFPEDLNQATGRAITLALQSGCGVYFTFNDYMHRVDPAHVQAVLQKSIQRP